jgi:hypothetical protein
MDNDRFANNSFKRVIVISAPISNRYWTTGCEGVINNGKIRVSGCWFDFDYRWEVEHKK